jgi:hypothetical protein
VRWNSTRTSGSGDVAATSARANKARGPQALETASETQRIQYSAYTESL